MNTWLNTVTTEASQFSGSGGCCNAEVRDSQGKVLNDKTNTMKQCMNGDNMNNWWTTKLQPPAEYSTITVEDPIHPLTLLALYGGWLSFMMMIGSILFDCGVKLCPAIAGQQDDSNKDDRTGDKRALELTAPIEDMY